MALPREPSPSFELLTEVLANTRDTNKRLGSFEVQIATLGTKVDRVEVDVQKLQDKRSLPPSSKAGQVTMDGKTLVALITAMGVAIVAALKVFGP